MEVSYKHLKRMTDNTGIIQFANKERPLKESGYTVDDNARALLVAINMSEKEAAPPAAVYLKFLSTAQRIDGAFTNLKIGDNFLPTIDSEDSIGRAFMACCFLLKSSRADDEMKQTSKDIIKITLPVIEKIRSLRAVSYILIGLVALAEDGLAGPVMERYVNRIGNQLKDAYHDSNTDTWKWYENWLTYCNALLPHALFSYYSFTGDKESLTIAEESLGFLTDALLKKGYLSVVGNKGWWLRNSNIPNFDQQPVDAASTTLACLEGYVTTGKKEYIEKASLSFQWYWGKNINSLELYDKDSGGCHDALIPGGLNKNQGAEAIVTFLLTDQMIKNILDERKGLINGQNRSCYIPAV